MIRNRRCGPPKFVFFFFAVVALFVFSAIVMWLWNAVLPGLLMVKSIGYWQAMGLLVLSKILFGFRGPGGRPGGFSNKRLREKFQSMTDEERQQFREEWRNRCRMRSWKKRSDEEVG